MPIKLLQTKYINQIKEILGQNKHENPTNKKNV